MIPITRPWDLSIQVGEKYLDTSPPDWDTCKAAIASFLARVCNPTQARECVTRMNDSDALSVCTFAMAGGEGDRTWLVKAQVQLATKPWVNDDPLL